MSKTAGYSKRPRLDKLGIKEGARVAVLRLADADFEKELAKRTSDVALRRPRCDSDVIVYHAKRISDLDKLQSLKRQIKPNGAIWVLWLKGRPELKANHVRTAALAIGLVDVKVAAFSEALSALKLVIPVAKR